MDVATLKVRELGDYIREQRQASSISLRQLARLANVSNPYLSQIERGLRKPSAEILQQIAKALRISAEALYVQAGILDEREGDTDVPGAILRDEWINERQKQVLLEIYDSFRKENDGLRQTAEAEAEEAAAADAGDRAAATDRPAKPAKPAKATATKAAKTAKATPAKPDEPAARKPAKKAAKPRKRTTTATTGAGASRTAAPSTGAAAERPAAAEATG